MDLIEVFREELAAIKRAPVTFAIGFVILAALIAAAEYSWIFKEWLARKDSVIQDKESTISDKNHRIRDLENELKSSRRPPIPAKAPPSGTGAATAFGDNSPANTGNGNTFNLRNTTVPNADKK